MFRGGTCAAAEFPRRTSPASKRKIEDQMKRCPTCNRTFEEDWLAFCTQDGTTLVDDSPSKGYEPAPTIMAPAPPPPSGGWQSPSGGLGSGQSPSQPIPPPPSPSNVPAP